MTRKSRKKGKNPKPNEASKETDGVETLDKQETECFNEKEITCQGNEIQCNGNINNSQIEERRQEAEQNGEENCSKTLADDVSPDSELTNDKENELCNANHEKETTRQEEVSKTPLSTQCQSDKLVPDGNDCQIQLPNEELVKNPPHTETEKEKECKISVIPEKVNSAQEENKNSSSRKGSKSQCCVCGAIGQRCSKCHSAVFCLSCVPRHFHDGRCLPWTIKDVPEFGRCLVTTRHVNPLEVVIEDSAVLTVPTCKLSCLGCGRGVNCVYSCPSCHLPMCGTGCPRADSHSTECPLLSQLALHKLSPEDKYHPIFTAVGCIRFLEMKNNEPTNYSKLVNLDPQSDKVKADKLTSKLLNDIKELLKCLHYEEEDIENAYSLLKLYGYTLPDVPDSKVRSLFPVQSLISHSCLPNLQYIEKEGGRKIVLQSTTKISPGERLTVRYTPFLQGRISLTKWLSEQRYFECRCGRCVDGTELGTFTSSALCDQETCRVRGGLLLPVDPINRSDWICSSCQRMTPQSKVEEVEEKYIAKFKELSQGDLNGYYKFLNELGDRFHASHHLVMRMAQFLVLLQGKHLESLSRERIETQSVLCDKLLAYMSRLDPGATQNRAKLLLEKNKADLNLAKLDCEAGLIPRKVFMAKLKEGVRVEVNAKKILYFKWKD